MLFEKNQALEKLVENMKRISPVLYSEMTAENMADHLKGVETNASIYLKKYEEETGCKQDYPPEREESYIFDLIDTHLQQGICQLDPVQSNLLLENNIMLWLLKK